MAPGADYCFACRLALRPAIASPPRAAAPIADAVRSPSTIAQPGGCSSPRRVARCMGPWQRHNEGGAGARAESSRGDAHAADAGIPASAAVGLTGTAAVDTPTVRRHAIRHWVIEARLPIAVERRSALIRGGLARPRLGVGSHTLAGSASTDRVRLPLPGGGEGRVPSRLKSLLRRGRAVVSSGGPGGPPRCFSSTSRAKQQHFELRAVVAPLVGAGALSGTAFVGACAG